MLTEFVLKAIVLVVAVGFCIYIAKYFDRSS